MLYTVYVGGDTGVRYRIYKNLFEEEWRQLRDSIDIRRTYRYLGEYQCLTAIKLAARCRGPLINANLTDRELLAGESDFWVMRNGGDFNCLDQQYIENLDGVEIT